jgi:hypothetical protein
MRALGYIHGMRACYNCHKELQASGRIGRTEECPYCRADLHCCRNCSFFDPAKSKQCREPAAELVREKTKANYCDFFSFADGRSGAPDRADEKSRQELESLFKKPGTGIQE